MLMQIKILCTLNFTIALPIWKCSFLLNRWCNEDAIASNDETARESSARILQKTKQIN